MSDFEGAIDIWAQRAGCADINLVQTNEFAKVWIWSTIYGLSLFMAITIPFCWCGAKKKASKDSRKVADEPAAKATDQAAPQGSQSLHSSQSLEPEHYDNPQPNYEAARRHLLRSSPTKNGRWRNPFTTSLHELSAVGGTGTELYFQMLRNFGFCFAYMAALTAPLTAFALTSDFGPDTGQALLKTTIGNLGKFISPEILEPASRLVIVGCQGMELTKLTQIFGWLDFLAGVIFLSFVAYFRFYRIPKSAREDDLDTISPGDFAVVIDKVPAMIAEQTHYEQLLREHLVKRLEYARSRTGCTDEKPPEVCEITFVRDYNGRLGDLKWQAELRQRNEIVEAYGKEKQIANMSKKLEKLNGRLSAKLKPDNEMPVVRVFAILNTTSDVDLLLNDYRFADYTLFRLLQFSTRRFQGHRIRIRPAPEPTDLIWENQDVPWWSRAWRRAVMILVFVVIIAVSISAIFLTSAAAVQSSPNVLSYIGNSQCDPVSESPGDTVAPYKCMVVNASTWNLTWAEDQGGDILSCFCTAQGYEKLVNNEDLLNACQGWFTNMGMTIGISTAASIIILVINVVLQICLLAMAEFERPLSITALNSSLMQKIAFAQTLNTGYVILLVNTWGTQGVRDVTAYIPLGQLLFRGPFEDIDRGWYAVVGAAILTNMLLNAVVPSCVSIVKGVVTWVKRRCMTRNLKHHAELLDVYTNPEFDIKAKYAQLLTTVFVTLTYSSGLPLLNLFAMAYMFCMYWADKFILLWGSKRPPMYNTQMAKDASEFMLYAVGIHCLFAILMYGQDCVFPSEILGGSLGQSVGDANQASQSGFVAEIAPRIAKQATWMQFALLLILVSLWAIWIVLWIIGGTFGEAWKFLVVTCCPSLHGGSQEEDLAAETDWNSAKAEIEANFPPASYRMERHPDFRVFAKSLRTSSVAKPGSPALPAVPPVADVIGQAQEVNKGGASSEVFSPKVPVPAATATLFLQALTDEYVRGKEAAVGTFFTANEISQPEQAILNAFEDHIRNATDKQAEIGKLSEKWGLDLVIESAR